MLTHARGWLRTAIALAALAGLRMGEVRALDVRDVDVYVHANGSELKSAIATLSIANISGN
jgi:integrase